MNPLFKIKGVVSQLRQEDGEFKASSQKSTKHKVVKHACFQHSHFLSLFLSGKR
jgi:hypothetical protein